MTPTMYRVVDRVDEDVDTVTITLEADAEPLARPSPGQFHMLWAFGIGEAPISIAGLDGHRQLHTIRRVGAVTAALARAEPGEPIGVRGPFGTAWDLPAARGRDVLVVAGGLGLAPVRPLVEAVLADRAAFGEVTFLFGARSPAQLLYRDELASWRGRFDVGVEVTVDSAGRHWRGDVGVVTKLLDRARGAPADTIAYVCGPEVMMRFAAGAIAERGTPPGQIEVSLERNMHCAVGHCGHCQLGPHLLCRTGPVLPWSDVSPLLAVRER